MVLHACNPGSSLNMGGFRLYSVAFATPCRAIERMPACTLAHNAVAPRTFSNCISIVATMCMPYCVAYLITHSVPVRESSARPGFRLKSSLGVCQTIAVRTGETYHSNRSPI